MSALIFKNWAKALTWWAKYTVTVWTKKSLVISTIVLNSFLAGILFSDAWYVTTSVNETISLIKHCIYYAKSTITLYEHDDIEYQMASQYDLKHTNQE